MPEISIAGRRLHYLEAGSGPALVLLHAFPLHAASFTPQLEGLAARVRVIAPDLRGFGRSAATTSPAEMGDFAGDVLELLDVLRLERPVVGGVSMGGYVSLALLRLDPTRLAGIVLMNTHARADDDAARAGRETNVARVLESGMEALVESMLPRLLSPHAPDSLRERVARLIRENPPQGAVAALRAMALRPDSRELLSRYAGPVLVVSGEADAMIPPERGQEMADLVPGAEHLRIPGVGHLSFLEAPAIVNDALVRFLDRATSH